MNILYCGKDQKHRNNPLKKVLQLNFERQYLSQYYSIIFDIGIVGKPVYFSLHRYLICYDYEFMECARRFSKEPSEKWKVAKYVHHSVFICMESELCLMMLWWFLMKCCVFFTVYFQYLLWIKWMFVKSSMCMSSTTILASFLKFSSNKHVTLHEKPSVHH